ncbi:MAG: CAP domain-containing protein [Gemmatimonadota bacterium]
MRKAGMGRGDRGFARSVRSGLGVLVLAALVAGAGARTRQEARESLADPEIRELYDLVNAHRRVAGCRPLAWHAGAAHAAALHSSDMAEHRYVDHRNPNGDGFEDRLVKAGIRWRGPGGENLALTPAGPASAMEMWLDSPHHRANIEDCRFTHEGIGVARGFWTQILLTDPAP